VIVALESIKNTSSAERRGEAVVMIQMIRTFEFVFSIHLIRNILGIASELSLALQKKDQDIVNAILKVARQRFQEMRCDG